MEHIKNIIDYYASMQEMMHMLIEQKRGIEDRYYTGICGMCMDGMPSGHAVGSRTEKDGILAADNDAGGELARIERKLATLKRDKEIIETGLDAINGIYKHLIIERAINRRSWVKISAMLHMSNSGARYWYARAKARLWDALKGQKGIEELLERADKAKR